MQAYCFPHFYRNLDTGLKCSAETKGYEAGTKPLARPKISFRVINLGNGLLLKRKITSVSRRGPVSNISLQSLTIITSQVYFRLAIKPGMSRGFSPPWLWSGTMVPWYTIVQQNRFHTTAERGQK